MSIVKADITNINDIVYLASLLFTDDTYEELCKEYKDNFANEKNFFFLYESDGKYAGFIHLSIRNDYVNGTVTSPVAYVEAIYVLPKYRKQGVGRELMKYVEKFACEQKITQLASDCLIDNKTSEDFHKSCGFAEKERVICFVKNISPEII